MWNASVSDRGRHQYPGTKTGTPGIPAGYLNTYIYAVKGLYISVHVQQYLHTPSA